MAGSMSRHLPENGATWGCDQMPLCSVAIMIVMLLPLCVKNTVLPSGVNAGAESSPPGQALSG